MIDLDSIPGELITFRASDSLELQGFLVKSKKRTGKVVVHIHGLTGNFFRSATMKKMLPYYLSSGYDFFFTNTRGHGLITSMYRIRWGKAKRVVIGTTLERFEDCVKDLRGVANLLHSKGYKKIILQGHSTGCQKATYYMYKTKDRRISALVLLAPADDYNITKKELKKNWTKAVNLAKKMTASKKSDELMPKNMVNNEVTSAQRFLSRNDLSRVEARIFNYESENFKEFSAMTLPVIAIFGSKEQYRTKSVKIYLEQLQKATQSKNFASVEIAGGNHDFKHHEAETAKAVVSWLDKVTE